MAERKKPATVRRGKSAARAKAPRSSKSARRQNTNRIGGKPMVKKRPVKTKLKRAGVKKVVQKKEQPMKPSSTPEVETVIGDVVEKPVPGVITVTEFEETQVREPPEGPKQPDRG